ncbi:MAG: hypothetical protein Q4D02_02740 [Clostridia bacterium]|nr:hypothetical protein [Clostridia bacterium]
MKQKRNISVLTVFLWIMLIAIMVIITINSVKESNAILEDAPTVVFKLKTEGISDDEVSEFCERLYFTCEASDVEEMNRYTYTNRDGNYYVYSLEKEEKVFLTDTLEELYIGQFLNGQIPGYDCYTEFEIDGVKYHGNWPDVRIENFDIAGKNEITIYVTKKFVKNDEQAVVKSAKWIHKEQGIAQIKLQYLPVLSETMYKNVGMAQSFQKVILYVDKLSDDFELSSEYMTNDEWTIVESLDDDEMARVSYEIYQGKKYIYIKPTNTIYWYIDKNEFATSDMIETFEFNILYKKMNDETPREEMLDTNSTATCMIDSSNVRGNITISSPTLEYIRKREAIIKIHKEVNSANDNSIHYIGLFTDELSNQTDYIAKIELWNGKGDTTIEIEHYNLNDQYYVYEVDENGNKIDHENLIYSRNQVNFEKDNSLSIREITSNENIISGYLSEDINGEDLGKGLGKESYVDNVLSIRDVYEDCITISSKEIELKVTYIAEEGGTIVGEDNEIVKPDEYPKNVPTPKADEGYRFIRWEVEKDGERIEVIPSEYKIVEDTIFYAIFEKIPVEKTVDTSDIHVGVYVGIFLISFIIICMVVIIMIQNNGKNRN